MLDISFSSYLKNESKWLILNRIVFDRNNWYHNAKYELLVLHNNTKNYLTVRK